MTLLRVRGIPVRLHPSFLALAAALVVGAGLLGGLPAVGQALLLGIGTFGSVVLHELGHALMARRFGVGTRAITLVPFGGIAALTREPDGPTAEAAIALAGPAVNFGLAGLAGGLALAGVPGLGWLAGVNLAMGLFNLLPAWPMDGGRVLRAAWTRRMGRVAATLRALRLSRWLAVGMVAVGVVTSPNVALIGAFLLLTTWSEGRRLAALGVPTRGGRTRTVLIDPPPRVWARFDHPVR
jgi:Zn-dependent protease